MPGDAGVVHHDVDAAEGVFGLADHPVNIVSVAHIGGHRQTFPAKGLHRDGGLFHCSRVDVRHGDMGPSLRKSQSYGPAHTSAGAGNHRDLVLKLHRFTPIYSGLKPRFCWRV